jgi:hypothetical protein
VVLTPSHQQVASATVAAFHCLPANMTTMLFYAKVRIAAGTGQKHLGPV